MKRLSWKEIRRLFLTLCVFMLIPASVSFAASKPDAVETVKVSDVSGTEATLSWTSAKNATGYNIYRLDPETGDIIGSKPVKTTTGLSCTVPIKPGTMNSFQVFAYAKDGNQTIEEDEGSLIIDVEPKTLRLLCRGNECAFLEWDMVKGANGYILYRYDTKKKEYRQVKKLKATSCKVKIPSGKTYRYMLRSYRRKGGKTVLSTNSNVVKVKGKKYESVIARRWLSTLKEDVKVTDTNTGRKVTLKKGTKLLTSTRTNLSIKATVVGSKKSYTVKGTSLEYADLYLTPTYDYYNKDQSEAFINGRGYSSKTKYLIWISQYTASVHFFTGSKGHWKQQRVVKCVIGGPSGHTMTGEREIIDHQDGTGHVFFYWNPSKNWGQSFHGYIDGNTRGALSSGCIRLADADYRYVQSLPVGTKIVSY